MATTTTQTMRDTTPASAPAVIRTVQAPSQICGDCRFHIPFATKPGGWCSCAGAELRWKPVAAGRAVCDHFAVWPDDSPVPAFLEAMKF